MIYSDIYWDKSRVVESHNLAISKCFLFNDTDLMEKLIEKVRGEVGGAKQRLHSA